MLQILPWGGNRSVVITEAKIGKAPEHESGMSVRFRPNDDANKGNKQ
jgi:hypothetical protein